ncbi:MAG: penicillin-binding protein 2 [Deltaproteobacteria bacterium]|nr:penicillin-binding protein 2 [Deltaproteobacteria bacterium]
MPLFVPQVDLSRYKACYFVMLLLMSLAFVLLMGRLYVLQIEDGQKYATLSRSNFVSLRRQEALRGMIFDKHGRLLADNQPSFNVYFTPAFCQRDAFEDTQARLTEYLGLSEDEIDRVRDYYSRTKGLDRFLPMLVRREVGWAELAMLEQQIGTVEGVEVRPETKRAYPYHALASHLLGYVGEVNSKDLERLKDQGYRQGDVIGKVGVEHAWESQLRGRHGLVQVVVNARGQRMPEAQTRDVLGGDPVLEKAVAGNNIFLSIDARLQELAEERFPGREGAAVAVDPKTGFILALVSKPGFDPNMISGHLKPRMWRKLVEDIDRPLHNRVTQQHYPPGSTFKPFTGLAALHEGAIDSDSRLTCTGQMRYGDHTFRCWRGGGHGSISIHKALVQSCDVFFYRAGRRVGLDAIASMSWSFGFGSLTGFESCEEVPGIMPDRAWYESHTKTGFLPGFTISDSIGQGDVNVTPLQLAMGFAAIANGGVLYRPQVVRRIESADKTEVQNFSPVVRWRVKASDEHLQLVAEALAGVVNEVGGTGYYRRPRKVDFQVAGKTGTAQVVKQGADRGRNLPYDFKDHAWFAGWAPVDDPQIVVAVVNEHGGHGSSGAAPLVMEMITYYLEQLVDKGPSAGEGLFP